VSSTPSKYQAAIYDWIKQDKGRVLTVEAVAGSGKSTTLLGALKEIVGQGRGVFLAFNKKIVLEFEEKTKAAKVDFPIRTFNGLGYKFLRADKRWDRAQAGEQADRKYFWVAKDYFEAVLRAEGGIPQIAAKLAARAAKAVDLVMNTLHDLEAGQEAFERLCLRYEIDPTVSVINANGKQYARSVTTQDMALIMEAGLSDQRRMTFAEQIYLPATGKAGRVEEFAWVLVDEAQDLNPARLRLVERMIGKQGRAIFVGDSFQAIYGFTGADTRSMATIRTRLKADTLPLSICYRCPPNHIELVKRWPNPLGAKIEAVPGRADGLLEWESGTGALFFEDEGGRQKTKLAAGDLVICRKNAPLVGLFLQLIRAKVPARIEGRGLAEQYADLAEDVLSACEAPEWREAVANVELLSCLDEWQRQKLDALEKRFGRESWIYEEESKRLGDEVEVLAALWDFHAERKGSQSAAAFRATLKDLFSEDHGQTKVVRLSSVHRAKGLEAQTVYWLGPQEHRVLKDDPEAMQQENNLEYVALTRSKHRLVIVGEPDPRLLLGLLPAPQQPQSAPSAAPNPASPTSIEGVLAASRERQRGLEDLLARLRAALEREGLGQYGRWDAWVPFNAEIEAHKAAWGREAVMPDEVKAAWTGRPFTPSTYAQELGVPMGVALGPESRPNPGRVELLIKAERDYRAEIHAHRYLAGLITMEQAEALTEDEYTPKTDRAPDNDRRALLAGLAAIWNRLPSHPSRPWPVEIRSLLARQIKLLGELERLREASKPWSARD
jgi:superfamily I DNA/RNA helicase